MLITSMALDQDRHPPVYDLVRPHLEAALSEDEPTEKNYHIREALQLLLVDERSAKD